MCSALLLFQIGHIHIDNLTSFFSLLYATFGAKDNLLNNANAYDMIRLAEYFDVPFLSKLSEDLLEKLESGREYINDDLLVFADKYNLHSKNPECVPLCSLLHNSMLFVGIFSLLKSSSCTDVYLPALMETIFSQINRTASKHFAQHAHQRYQNKKTIISKIKLNELKKSTLVLLVTKCIE